MTDRRRSDIDDARILPRFRGRKVEQLPAPLDSSPAPASGSQSTTAVSKLPGDPWTLRGFPIVSQGGLGGVMPGTQPEQWILANDPFGDDE